MNWKHSLFDIAYRIIGQCFTPDEMYRVLCELEQDRELAFKSSEAENQRAIAADLIAKEVLEDTAETKANKAKAKATLMDNRAKIVVATPCYTRCKEELEYIRRVKNIVAKHRLLSKHEDAAAFQLIQPIEHALSTVYTALLEQHTSGSISLDSYNEALVSPFKQAIMSALSRINTTDRTYLIQNRNAVLADLFGNTVLESTCHEIALCVNRIHAERDSFLKFDSVILPSLEHKDDL